MDHPRGRAEAPLRELLGAALPDRALDRIRHRQRQTDGQAMTREERFWAKTDRQSVGCWMWMGARDQGYGRFWNGASAGRAHRYSYELLIGPIPEGLTLDHLCRNPACVNPAHLEPVTVGVNVRRRPGARMDQTRCKYGHALDDANTYVTTRGFRACRTCGKRQTNAWRARRKSRLAGEVPAG